MVSFFRSKRVRFGILILLAAAVNLAAAFPDAIESYYSRLIFPHISLLFRTVWGFLPFSIGDLLYLILMVWLVLKLYLIIRQLITGIDRKKILINACYKSASRLLVVYLIFYTLWGLNYFRRGVELQFGFKNLQSNHADLRLLTTELKNKLNRSKALCTKDHFSLEYLQTAATASFRKAELQFNFIQYRQPSIKTSIYSEIGNHVGFLGYYNPFTGESQINRACPSFLQPFITCHEVAHQLGYASESEANFIGFIASVHSDIPEVQYSAYLHMYLYASGKLRWADSSAAKNIYKELLPSVKADINQYSAYLLQYENPIQEGSDFLYDVFLKQNRQVNGLKSYGEAIRWLIAFRTQYGYL